MNNYEEKAKIVNGGNSKILNNWMEHSAITAADFLTALEWVCGDPLDSKGRMTREIGLTPAGIVKLDRVYSTSGICGFYHNGKLWNGAWFERPAANDKERRFYGEKIRENHKISLSCKDRV